MNSSPVFSRRGVSSLEMLVAVSSAAILMAGLSGVLFLASKSLDITIDPPSSLAAVGSPLGRLQDDLREATSITRDGDVLRVIVPDRNGDGIEDTFAYRIGTARPSQQTSQNAGEIFLGIENIKFEKDGSSDAIGDQLVSTDQPTSPDSTDQGTRSTDFPSSADNPILPTSPRVELITKMRVGKNEKEAIVSLPDYTRQGDLYLVGIALDTVKGTVWGPDKWDVVDSKKANNGGSSNSSKSSWRSQSWSWWRWFYSNRSRGNYKYDDDDDDDDDDRNSSYNKGTPKCQAAVYSYTALKDGPSSHKLSWNQAEKAIVWLLRIRGAHSSEPIGFSASHGGLYTARSVFPKVVTLEANVPNSIGIQFITAEYNGLQRYRSGLPAYTDYLFEEECDGLAVTLSVRNLRDKTGRFDENTTMQLNDKSFTNWVNIGAVICPR